MAGRPIHQGVVTAFDDQTGLGTVTAADGTVLGFHCTAIADGSRTIATGLDVRFRVAAAGGGRWEAVAIVPG